MQRQKGVGLLVSIQERTAAVVPLINRSSTARQPVIVFPHSVYIGLRLSLLSQKRYECFSWSADQRYHFPGHALHEKGLQRQTGVGSLVRSQERRAAVVPRINRLSTARQPPVNRLSCSSIGLHRISFVRASGGSFKTVVYDAPGGTRDGFLLGEPTRLRPVLPHRCPAAPPCAAPPRPARGMSGFWIRQVASEQMFKKAAFDALGLENVRSCLGRSAAPRLRPAPPHPAASPCSAPPQPARRISGFLIRQIIPGYALHWKGLQWRQTSFFANRARNEEQPSSR